MKYFDYLNNEEKEKLFYKLPKDFNKNSSIEVLRYAIGGLLYIPSIDRKKLFSYFNGSIKESNSVVMCLEDSIGESGENEAINNIKEVLEYIRQSKNEVPLIFIRPRNIKQLVKIKDILVNNLDLLCGIVIPKANALLIDKFIEELKNIKCDSLYIMPIIETVDFTSIDKKEDSFIALNKAIYKYKDKIINVRIGVTDILGAYKLRRSKKYTIYDNLIFRNFTSDLISTVTCNKDIDMVVSGGVSEFYNMNDEEILNSYIKEIELDKMNGFIGKTVIHPQQLKLVQSLLVISYEDYIDACNIIEQCNSIKGVSASLYKNRMNEVNPHLAWAKKIIKLSSIFGVFNEGVEFSDLTRI